MSTGRWRTGVGVLPPYFISFLKPTRRTGLMLAVAGTLSLGNAAHGQVSSSLAPPVQRSGIQSLIAAIPSDCPATPVLKAVSGNGVIKLDAGKTTRIPYGVRYRFRHSIPSAEFVLVSLSVNGTASQSVEAQRTGTGSPCYDVQLPELPVDVPVTLAETQGFALPDSVRTALRIAVSGVLSGYLDILFSGQNQALYGRPDTLRAALDQQLTARGVFAPFGTYRVRAGNGTRLLADTVKSAFLANISAATDLPGWIREAKDLEAELRGAALQCGSSTPAGRRMRALLAALAAIPAMRTGSAVLPLYAQGRLPLPDSLVAHFVEDAATCGILNASENAVPVQQLATNPLQRVFDAADQARRVVEESFVLSASDIFPGATTTLQRYGQIDVANAFFGSVDNARILTTFSFYPGDLAYGGEIQPHDANDRVVVTLGYSLATVTESEGDRSPRGRAYTVGLGLRLTPQLSFGGGGWFSEEKRRGWYLSFSGDLGTVPGLQSLFVRNPNE